MEQEKLYKGLKCKNALAFAIRDAQSKYKSGYVIYGKDPYYHYLSNDDWRQFLTSMSQLHQAQYKDADGGELKEKNSRHGILPPKMASFASSSRFIYECSKSITGFCFEKQLPTRVGHTANLDGFLFADGFDSVHLLSGRVHSVRYLLPQARGVLRHSLCSVVPLLCAWRFRDYRLLRGIVRLGNVCPGC